VAVHEANLQDRESVPLLLEPLKSAFPRMKKVWVDQAYTGKGREWMEAAKWDGKWRWFDILLAHVGCGSGREWRSPQKCLLSSNVREDFATCRADGW
jgi:hypothetical protein